VGSIPMRFRQIILRISIKLLSLILWDLCANE